MNQKRRTMIIKATCRTEYNPTDAHFSREGFQRVWDTGVLQEAGFSSPTNVEETNEDLKEATDYHALIDGKDARVAFRAQRGFNWGTFTVRSARSSGCYTEWGKYLAKVNHGAPGPDYVIHAYISDVTVFALAETKTIVRAIREKHCGENSSNARFFYVQWDDIEKFYPDALLLRYPKFFS